MPPENEKQRSRNNLVVFAVVAVIVVLGVLLMQWLAHALKEADCVAAGHRNCAPVETSDQQ